MSWPGLLLGLGAVWLLGAAATTALAVGRSYSTADAPLHIALGAVLLGSLGSLCVVTGIVLSPALVYGIGATVLLLAAHRFSRDPARPRSRPAGMAGSVPGIVTALALLVQLATATRDRLWWDGWAIWSLKARVLFLEGRLPAAMLVPDGRYGFTHPDYPLLLPLAQWWAFEHFGAPDAAAAAFLGACWSAAVVFSLWLLLRKQVGERLAASASLGLALFWPQYFFASGGTADVVIAFAMLGAVASLHQALSHARPERIWTTVVFICLGILSKNEGLALALVASIVVSGAILHGWWGARHHLVALLLPFLTAAPWMVWTHRNGLRPDHLSSRPSAAALFERMPPLADGVMTLATTLPWLPLFPLALLGLMAAVRQADIPLLAPWSIVLGYFAAVCYVYLQAPQDLTWLIATSLQRVLSGLVPAVVYLALVSTRPPPLTKVVPPHVPGRIAAGFA